MTALLRLQQNDHTLRTLYLGDDHDSFPPNADIAGYNSNFTAIGTAIGSNTKLKELVMDTRFLEFWGEDGEESDTFFNGIRTNTSINEFRYVGNAADDYIEEREGLLHKICQTYQDNHVHLTHLRIEETDLRNLEDVVIDTIRSCTNLIDISLYECGLSFQQIIAIAQELPRRQLKSLRLDTNRPSLYGNLDAPVEQLNQNVAEVYCNLVCDTSNGIDSIYSSHHTIEELMFSHYNGKYEIRPRLRSLLDINSIAHKYHVAKLKVILFSSNIDMSVLFEVGGGEDGERTIKALPYVVDTFFDSALEAIRTNSKLSHRNDYIETVDKRKLSAIYQFTKAMPTLFEGIKTLGD